MIAMDGGWASSTLQGDSALDGEDRDATRPTRIRQGIEGFDPICAGLAQRPISHMTSRGRAAYAGRHSAPPGSPPPPRTPGPPPAGALSRGEVLLVAP